MNKEEKKILSAEGEIEDTKGTMRKKILVLVLLLLCVGALITLVIVRAGTPMVDFWTVSGSLPQNETKLAGVERIEAEVSERVDSRGTLALYESVGADGIVTQTVVNLRSGTVVASLKDEDATYAVSLYEVDGGSAWYSVTQRVGTDESAVYSFSMHDENGKMFAEKQSLTEMALDSLKFHTVLDLVRLEKDVFRIAENGTVKEAFTLSEFAVLPEFTGKAGNYYYRSETRGGAVAYYAYDDEATLTAIYHSPADAEDVNVFILSDGTLLSQYLTLVGESDSEYTFAKNGKKYKLHHVLVSARTGAKTQLDKLDFYIKDIISEDSDLRESGWNTSIDNLVFGYAIENFSLDEGDYAQIWALLSNRGKITSTVGDIVPAMHGMIIGVAKNRWIAKNLADEYFLLNEWGAILGRFPTLEKTECASRLFVYEKKIYSWDLALLYNMEENGVTEYTVVGSSVLMKTDEGEVLLYNGETQTVLTLVAKGEEGEVSVPDGSSLILLQKTVEGKAQCLLYNEVGDCLITIEAEEVVVFAHMIDGKCVAEILAESGETKTLYFASTRE